MATGPRNSLCDVAGIRVGHADDSGAGTGTTAILFDEPVIAAVDVRGGGPGTRDIELLDPERTVEHIDALALSGGSAFGLDACGGVMAWLAENGRGFPVGTARVPIVPGAVVFDLMSGGDKEWGRFGPYRDLGYAAAAAACLDFAQGSVGAGHGARTQNLKGGLGSASALVPELGCTVGALAVANAVGRVTVGDGPHFWAAPFEQDGEFGGLGPAPTMPADALDLRVKGGPGESTTLVAVATDAALTGTQARRLAVMAQDGLARAILPAHAPLDGDLVFAASTGRVPLADPIHDLTRLGHVAAMVVARAIAVGVHRAAALPFPGAQAAWRDRFRGPAR